MQSYYHPKNLETMNTKLVESLAQIITSLTPTERELLVAETELLDQKTDNNQEKPFYETATKEEWIKAFEEWASSHPKQIPPLCDYAVSRESMYKE